MEWKLLIFVNSSSDKETVFLTFFMADCKNLLLMTSTNKRLVLASIDSTDNYVGLLQIKMQ